MTMTKIPLYIIEDSVQRGLQSERGVVVRENSGYITIDNDVLSINLIDEYHDKGAELPSIMKQWQSKFDFNLVTIKAGISPLKEDWIRGASEFQIQGQFEGEIQPYDAAPKTEWRDLPYSGSLEFGINSIENLLKLVPIPLPDITTKVRFTYNWNPKGRAVTSFAAGQRASWTFDKVGEQYLDGDFELKMLFRKPKTLSNAVFHIDRASVIYESSLPLVPSILVTTKQDVRVELP